MTPLTLSIPEAAALLGVSERLAYELAAAGELPTIELGRRRLIPRRAIDQIIEASLADFDPNRLVSQLASAAGSSSATSAPPWTQGRTLAAGTGEASGDGEGPTGPTRLRSVRT